MNTLEFAQRGSKLLSKHGRNRLTREQREAMVDEFVAGKSSGILARKYKVCPTYVCALAHRRGYKRRARAA